MKNPCFLSFERSRYMAGRYVSALDLSRDQDYGNNKRRLINRLLHGYGVVCGLNVSMPDEYTVAIESGCALDYVGREIVVPSSHTRKLRQLDGFDPQRECAAYLCMEYAKELADPVHVLSSDSAASGNEPQFSSSRDSFRLFLTYEEPPENALLPRRLIEDTLTLYDGGGVRITQSLPRFVRPEEEFELIVRVDKRGQPLPVTLTYDLSFVHCTHLDRDFCHIHFEEEPGRPGNHFELRVPLLAGKTRGANARVQFGEYAFQIGGRAYVLRNLKGHTFEISGGNVRQAVFDRYMSQNLEGLLEESASLYLARLQLIRLGDTSILDSVEPLPFEQRLVNSQLSTAFLMMGELPVQTASPPATREPVRRPGGYADCKTGRAIIDLSGGGEVGKTYFSSEIAHGLGPGRVFIQTALAPEGSDKTAVQGSLEHPIFPVSPPRCAIAARCEYHRGTFTLGVKLLEVVEGDTLEFTWMALRDSAEAASDTAEKGIYILPDLINLRTRESRKLEAYVTGLPDKGHTFFVREENGGTVDNNGNYTAPGIPGVYEVVARSTFDETVSNSVFIVVRERTL